MAICKEFNRQINEVFYQLNEVKLEYKLAAGAELDNNSSNTRDDEYIIQGVLSERAQMEISEEQILRINKAINRFTQDIQTPKKSVSPVDTKDLQKPKRSTSPIEYKPNPTEIIDIETPRRSANTTEYKPKAIEIIDIQTPERPSSTIQFQASSFEIKQQLITPPRPVIDFTLNQPDELMTGVGEAPTIKCENIDDYEKNMFFKNKLNALIEQNDLDSLERNHNDYMKFNLKKCYVRLERCTPTVDKTNHDTTDNAVEINELDKNINHEVPDNSMPKIEPIEYNIVESDTENEVNMDTNEIDLIPDEIQIIPHNEIDQNQSIFEVNIETSRAENPYECYKCHKCFGQANDLVSHFSSHSVAKNFKCEMEFCMQQFDTEERLKTHEKIHKVKFECLVCPKKFMSLNRLKRHKEEMHKVDENGNCDIRCPKCLALFDKHFQLKKHLKIHST